MRVLDFCLCRCGAVPRDALGSAEAIGSGRLKQAPAGGKLCGWQVATVTGRICVQVPVHLQAGFSLVEKGQAVGRPSRT